MKKLLIATTNKGKLKEFSEFLSSLPVELVSLKDVGITNNFEETGKTYKENSQLKAVFYSQKSGLPAIADDGGIEITALDGAPGIKSRRWLGHETSEKELIKYMKKISKELPNNNRQAFFRTVVTLALPTGRVWSVVGEVEGIIAKKPLLKVAQGYPYRSFFFLPKLNKYYFETELTRDEQKLYNHRWKAVEKLKPIIQNVILSTFVALSVNEAKESH